jgi:site-specific DNA-adenine methylase
MEYTGEEKYDHIVNDINELWQKYDMLFDELKEQANLINQLQAELEYNRQYKNEVRERYE